MTDADLLRQMSDAPMQLALQAGADALDDNPRLRDLNTRLQATVAGLEDSLAAATAELNAIKNPPAEYTVQAGDTLIGIARRHYVQWTDIQAWNGMGTSTVINPGKVLKLRAPVATPQPTPAPTPQPAPTARFPGDPGPGRILLGAATRGGNLARIAEHENATGRRLVRRRYWNDGTVDLDGPVRQAVLEDHRAGRIPAPSIKPGPFGTIAGSQAAQDKVRAFVQWAEQQPHPTWLIVDHEPENNLKGQPADAQHAGAAKFRADQQTIRQIINDVTGGKPRRLSFGGSLMGWNWATAAHTGTSAILAMPDEWFPGAGVWDWCGIDQYAQKAGGPILDTKWKALVPQVKGWGVPLAVTELGIRSADPDSGQKLLGFYDQLIAAGGVMLLYYDNDANSTGEGWILDDRGGQLTAWRDLLTDPRTANATV